MFKEFKEFAMKGSVLDMAIGVIMGGAFGAVVSSLTGDVLMPIVGQLTGGVDFKDMFIPLTNMPAGVPATLAEAKKANVPVVAYGLWVNSVISFLTVAFVMFLLVKGINKAKREEPAGPPPPPPKEEVLLTEIRDLLKTR